MNTVTQKMLLAKEQGDN